MAAREILVAAGVGVAAGAAAWPAWPASSAWGFAVREEGGRTAVVRCVPVAEKVAAAGPASADIHTGLWWSLHGTGVFVHRVPGAGPAPRSGSYGVAALWPVDSGSAERFADAAAVNARWSVEREPGCHGFGVIRSARDASVFALVELFDDRESFEQHLTTVHFREFAGVARPLYRGDRTQTVKGALTWL